VVEHVVSARIVSCVVSCRVQYVTLTDSSLVSLSPM
jgi:hypothetical protein